MARLSALLAAVQSCFGTGLRSAHQLHGGDLSLVQRIELSDGRQMVAKTGPLVEREADMLRAIANANVATPAILGHCDGHLFLELLTEGTSSALGWNALGHALRQLHSHCDGNYGWPVHYAFGSVSIPNEPVSNWPRFWSERRLRPSLPNLPGALADRVEMLCEQLPSILPCAPPAALLHGDLWSGNVLFGGQDSVHLIDPACYFGHAEVDLAMLTLFDTPDRRFWDAYGVLPAGEMERRAAYQLWPALVHFRLFGRGYQQMVEDRLTVLGH